MGERKGTKALELWCRRLTEGYPGVKIDNMTTSWRDGLGFCAIIHRFRPDLIDFSKLNKDDIYHNNELAFRIAEHHLGIPALLEPEDMVECMVPDRLSILTYLSQFYQAFAVTQRNSPNRIAPKRPQPSPDHGIVSPTSTSPPTKMAWAGGLRREPCSKCGLPVFIAERLNVGKRLFHRTCFRCARCSSQLALANYYETEAGEHCCEICPDEEKQIGRKVATDSPEKSVLFRSMSDEEKTASLKNFSEGADAYSTQFETAMEQPDPALARCYSEARSKFFRAHLDDDSTDSGNDDIPPDLPKSGPPKLESLSEADSGFPSHTAHSSVSDSASGQYDVTKEGLVKARTKLFEEKSDVHSRVAPSAALAAVVPLEDLEDFDEVGKQHVEPEENPPAEKQELDDVSNEKRENVSAIEAVETNPEDLNQEEIDLAVESPEDTPLEGALPIEEKSEDPIIVIDDSASIADSSYNVSKENQDLLAEDEPVVEILDSSEDKPADVIVIEDSPQVKEEITDSPDAQAPIITLQGNSENSFTTASSNLDSSVDSHVPSRGYYTAYEQKVEAETPVKSDVSIPEITTSSVEYPESLNPFGDEDGEEEKADSSISLNPFGEEEEGPESMPAKPVPSPRLRKKIMPTAEDKEIKGTPDHLAGIYMQRISVNPFEEEEEKPPQPANRKKKVIKAEKISLNPFESDDDQEREDAGKQPVPTPRTSTRASGGHPELPRPRPRDSAKTTPTSTLQKKKKPAPRPPAAAAGLPGAEPPRASDNDTASLTSSPSHSLCPSPRLTPRHRKSKRAPAPPGRTSTPHGPLENVSDRLSSTKISPVQPEESENNAEDLEREKCVKDEENRSRQQTCTGIESPTPSDTTSSSLSTDKSMHGKWKRGKGRAPPRPVPQRRAPRALPLVEIRRELEVIEVQQQGLERQGVRLEQIIRDKCEGEQNNTEDTVPIEVEDLILQLFELVNEKNELFRKQTELMYLKRQHRLEEEYDDVDYQIRCLMLQPEANKTDSDKAKEEELINRLVSIVERRNEIVECLEMDRVREAEEDNSINNQLNLYTLKREEKLELPKSEEKKKKHKHKKINKLMHTLHKHKDKEKVQRVDVDKDVDEMECKESNTATLDKKKKKKFNLF